MSQNNSPDKNNKKIENEEYEKVQEDFDYYSLCKRIEELEQKNWKLKNKIERYNRDIIFLLESFRRFYECIED